MMDHDAAKRPEAGRDTDAASDAKAFDALILRARLGLFWERLWPVLAVPLGIVVLFVAASWFDLFTLVTGLPRLGLSLLFLAGLVAALWRLRAVRAPGREEALARIDRASGRPHRPATTRHDRLVRGGGDPLAEALWQRHQRLALEASRNIRLGVPSPGLPALDRYGLRAGAILVLVVAFFYAGAERLPRLAAAFQAPGFDIQALLFGAPADEQAGTRLDAWVTPPAYTRRPPIVLGEANRSVPTAVPQNSVLVIRFAGDDSARIEASGNVKEGPSGEAPGAGVVERRLVLAGDATVTVRGAGGVAAAFPFTIVPDRPPVIAFAGPVSADSHGILTLSYKVEDDYGATSVEARGTLAPAEASGEARPLYGVPKIPLAPPASHARSGTVTVTRDLAADPLAGARVRMTLVARDDAGNEGHSDPQDVTLPQRSFTNPLARALIEQRLDLALDANRADEVKYALGALMIAPEDFTPDKGVYLGLRTAWDRLDNSTSDNDLRDAADYLWQIANAIEEGSGSQAERQLKAARENLRKALERGASPEEIARLTQELRQALNNFLQDYAKRQAQALKHGQAGQSKNTRTITPEELSKLLDQLENSAKSGNKDDASKLLSQLDDILNNLQNPDQGTAQQDPATRQMQQSLNDMNKMILRQQRLRDQTYRQNQPPSPDGQGGSDPQDGSPDQPGDGQPGGGGPQGNDQQGENGTPSPGDGAPGSGEPSPGALRQQQQALREQLEQMQKSLRDSGADAPGELGQAGKAMRNAEGQLDQGDGDGAVDSQGKAIEALRKAAKGLAQQLAQAQGKARGQGQGQQPGQGGRNGRDPLGRQYDNSVDGMDGPKIPGKGETPAQRAERVIEELRRRLADPNRPKPETDYLERLLNQE
ncbi:TIGR02302 family protein [Labrys monachus]|uniref:Uncharacterized protein (TIGR02302 family) n=1 Tax=Labrys monachus TaxID=217067 RepID=A0ABU0FPT4_9HYPH|nr:TIGR02302 family protein [Labrys monachus]MDQ0396377.1 uncharacterized protein (TIGR02302 family) [Labrys monachus]